MLSFSTYARFDYNNNCQRAMLAMLDLKTATARDILARENETNPGNGYVIYLEHYCESIELIITEDESLYEKLIDKLPGRLEQIAQSGKGEPETGWLQAEMLFHAGLAQIKFGSRVNGVRKMLSAFKRIREHREQYPLFWQNRKLNATFNIILDFIPPYMRWATDLFGYSGDAETGLQQLRDYCATAKSTPGLAEEAILYTGLGYKLSWKEELGYQFLSGQDTTSTDVILVKYLHASLASFTYRNDQALELLQEIHREDFQVAFYPLYYFTGRCKMNHLEIDAELYLKTFLDEYPGLDYKKDVCNRLSYYYLLNGNMQLYQEYRKKTSSVGQVLRERDREAEVESRSEPVPHTGLLKARLLCDGGYFTEADSVMNTIDPGNLSHTAYLLEYYYRRGRILQLTGQTQKAEDIFQECYYMGKNLPYTYATRSALQLGKISEEKGIYPVARMWYENCLDCYDETNTSDGVEQMAEKGISRVKKK
jgi:hypothetical protein